MVKFVLSNLYLNPHDLLDLPTLDFISNTVIPTQMGSKSSLDYGCQIGSKEQLQKVVNLLIKDGPERGLYFLTTS